MNRLLSYFFLSLYVFLGVLVLASLTGALGFSLSCFLSLLCSSLLVSFLGLALLQTLGDGTAASVKDYLYRILGVIVGRNHIVDVLGIRVCVHDGKNGDTQAVSLFYSDMLLHYVYDEESRRKTGQVGN